MCFLEKLCMIPVVEFVVHLRIGSLRFGVLRPDVCICRTLVARLDPEIHCSLKEPADIKRVTLKVIGDGIYSQNHDISKTDFSI